MRPTATPTCRCASSSPPARERGAGCAVWSPAVHVVCVGGCSSSQSTCSTQIIPQCTNPNAPPPIHSIPLHSTPLHQRRVHWVSKRETDESFWETIQLPSAAPDAPSTSKGPAAPSSMRRLTRPGFVCNLFFDLEAPAQSYAVNWLDSKTWSGEATAEVRRRCVGAGGLVVAWFVCDGSLSCLTQSHNHARVVVIHTHRS